MATQMIAKALMMKALGAVPRRSSGGGAGALWNRGEARNDLADLFFSGA